MPWGKTRVCDMTDAARPWPTLTANYRALAQALRTPWDAKHTHKTIRASATNQSLLPPRAHLEHARAPRSHLKRHRHRRRRPSPHHPMLPIVSYRQRQRRSNQRVLGPERDVGRGRRRPRLARVATQTCADLVVGAGGGRVSGGGSGGGMCLLCALPPYFGSSWALCDATVRRGRAAAGTHARVCARRRGVAGRVRVGA